jgi:RNase P subunit RPR2
MIKATGPFEFVLYRSECKKCNLFLEFGKEDLSFTSDNEYFVICPQCKTEIHQDEINEFSINNYSWSTQSYRLAVPSK